MDATDKVDNENANSKKQLNTWSSWTLIPIYFSIYLLGIVTFLLIIADPFTMSTYFSDNSLLPGSATREFSLVTEAEYYLKSLEKFINDPSLKRDNSQVSIATLEDVANYIRNELNNFGLNVYEQNFSFIKDGKQLNGTNIYSIVWGERSTSSEAIVLCAPFRRDSNSNTMSSVALSLAMAKYFSTKSYWAKDVIILFVDRDEYGLSSWLQSYEDVAFQTDLRRMSRDDKGTYYESLEERSGPIQAAIVVELHGRKFTQVNIKIQGMYGQLPNLDLFNLAAEMAVRESVSPYFHNKSLPFGLSDSERYQHHLETAIEFMKSQATMQSDGLHGLFLKHAIQSLTLEAHEAKKSGPDVLHSTLLNIGRLVECIFRSLNNLTERFNRSYYFYIILSLRRFTSIGYYMIAFGLTIAPVLLKANIIYSRQRQINQSIGFRAILLLVSALILSLLSTFNISAAMISSVTIVPILLVI